MNTMSDKKSMSPKMTPGIKEVKVKGKLKPKLAKRRNKETIKSVDSPRKQISKVRSSVGTLEQPNSKLENQPNLSSE